MRRKIIILFGFIIAGCTAALAMNLNESIDTALQNSPSVNAAQKNYTAAQARFYQAGGALAPHVTLNGSTGKSYNQPMTVTIPGTGSFSLSPDETAQINSYSLSLSQPLFTGGKLLQAFRIADASFQIAGEDLKKEKDSTSFNVVNAYYTVLKADKMVELNQQQIDNTQKYLDMVKVFYSSGLSTKADMLRVEAELANLRQAQIRLKNILTVSKLSFNSILGRDLKTEVSLQEPSENIFVDKEVAVPTLLKTAYEKRPEWRAFLQATRIADETVGLARGDFFPQLMLSGSYGSTYTNYPQTRHFDLRNWKAMVMGSFNIFDGFYNWNKVWEAQANVDMMKAQKQGLSDNIELEITSAASDLQSTYEQIAAAKITVDLSQDSFEYAEASYKSHIGTNIAVLDAQTLLFQSQSSLWSAKYDYQIAKAKINKAVGVTIFPVQ